MANVVVKMLHIRDMAVERGRFHEREEEDMLWFRSHSPLLLLYICCVSMLFCSL